jgi:menaquinone-dependent protoporphyrinogen IX oxidase
MGPILVVYASRTGCTREAAEIVAEALRAVIGAQVDVLPVQQAHDLSAYTAVVAGSAARHERGWVSEGRHWLRDHQAELGRLPVALFLTCWVLREGTPAGRRQAEGYMALALDRTPEIRPAALGLFPGRLDLARFSAFDRWYMRMKGAPSGDWFDPEQVRRWAEELPAKLAAGPAEAVPVSAVAEPAGRRGRRQR